MNELCIEFSSLVFKDEQMFSGVTLMSLTVGERIMCKKVVDFVFSESWPDSCAVVIYLTAPNFHCVRSPSIKFTKFLNN